MDIRESYDSAASAYAEHLFTELTHKPLDRQVLDRFADRTCEHGPVIDIGCGPGHVAKYLHERGVAVSGVDLSPEMIRVATQLSPGIEFRVGDMCALDLANESVAGIVAFYSIVHFDTLQLRAVFDECRRVLRPDGVLLLAFHIGSETVHVDDMWEKPVNLDFRFHQPNDVARALSESGFVVSELVEREPYPDVEFPSRRCYMSGTRISG